jgi:hypothetical protein
VTTRSFLPLGRQCRTYCATFKGKQTLGNVFYLLCGTSGKRTVLVMSRLVVPGGVLAIEPKACGFKPD